MSRSGYRDDCENLGLWRQAVALAIKGKRGQAFLREMAEAMDAMTDKKLIRGELIDHKGNCCALGVIYKNRQIDTINIDYTDPGAVGDPIGIGKALAAEIENENDDCSPWGIDPWNETSEQRWVRMRKWVAENLKA